MHRIKTIGIYIAVTLFIICALLWYIDGITIWATGDVPDKPLEAGMAYVNTGTVSLILGALGWQYNKERKLDLEEKNQNESV